MSYSYRSTSEIEIDKYLESNDAFYLRNLGKKNELIYLFNRYIIKNPDKKDIIEKILDNLDEYYYAILTHEQLKKIMKKEVDKKTTHVSEKLYSLLFDDELDIKEYIIKQKISASSFKSLISNFRKKYPYQEEEINRLNNIYNTYFAKNKQKNSDSNIKEYSNYELKVIEIFNSPYSIEEYCSIYGDSYIVAKNAIFKNNSNDEEIKNMASQVSHRDNSEFLSKLKDLCLYISLHEEFDILDYLDNTKLSLKDFKDIVRPYVPKEVLVEFIKRLSKLQTIDNNISIQNELKGDTFMAGRVITPEEKIKVFEYIKKRNYPLGVYNTVLRKYAYNMLDLDKVLVKK